jgi:hypothetical protein
MKIRLSVILVMAFAGIIAMSSCVKKYTCQCVIKYSGTPGLPDSSVQTYDITDSKSGATSKCKSESFSHDDNGIHTEETCTIF